MPFLYNLEKQFGRFAVPGILRYFVGFTAATYIFVLINDMVISRLTLDGQAILAGEAWRLVTWLFIPLPVCFLGFTPPIVIQAILMVFVLQLTWTFGDMLESVWGAFRLNLFLFVTIAISIALALVFQVGTLLFTVYFATSLLFAAATVAPNYQILFMMIIPLKLKWIALISLFFLLWQFLFAAWIAKLFMLLCFTSCFLFLGPGLVRQSRDLRNIAARRARFKAASVTPESIHRCETCGRTEISNPELDFRVSADGHEYCTTHLQARKSEA